MVNSLARNRIRSTSRLADLLALDDAAARSLKRVFTAGVEAYDREHHLPRLLPLTRSELLDNCPEAERKRLARLARALREERNRGRAGHWTYDLNRHIALRQAYLAERRLIEERK